MNSTRVSVIIPNHNRAELVCQTLENVLLQTLPPYEVIVVDDGSTDNSVQMIKENFAGRIKLLTQENLGPGVARNAGLAIATGDYIWLMDSDDLASLNKLESQVSVLQKTGADMVYSPWVKVSFEGKEVILQDQVLQQTELPNDHDYLWWFVNEWSNVLQQFLFKREFFKNLKFRENLFCGEDAELFVRMLLDGAKVTFDDQALTLYRFNNTDKLSENDADCRRQLDWASALVAISEEMQKKHMYESTVSLGFKLRLNEAYRELEHCSHIDCKKLGLALKHFEKLCHVGMPSIVIKWKMRLETAYRYRILGHRFNRSFQVAPIDEKQVALIEELGFSVNKKVGV